MLHHRYIGIILSFRVLVAVFLSFWIDISFSYGKDEDSDDKCKDMFSGSLDDTAKSYNPFFIKKTDSYIDTFRSYVQESASVRILRDKKIKIVGEYKDILDLIPDIADAIHNIGFQYACILINAKAKLSKMSEEQRIDTFLLLTMIKDQIFNNYDLPLVDFLDTDMNSPQYKKQVIAKLKIDQIKDFNEAIDILIKEHKENKITSNLSITSSLSGLAHEMHSVSSWSYDRVSMEFLESKLKTMDTLIQRLCYTVASFVIINRILPAEIKNSSPYQSMEKQIRFLNSAIYSYVINLSKSFIKNLYGLSAHLKSKDLITFLKLAVTYYAPFEYAIHPYSTSMGVTNPYTPWMLLALSTKEYIDHISSSIKPIEEMEGVFLPFDQLLTYFQARSRFDFLRFTSEICGIDETTDKSNFIVQDDLISLISTMSYWISTRYKAYTESERIPRSEVMNMLHLAYNEYLKLNSINKFFFIWYMSYVTHIYESQMDSKIASFNRTIRIYLVSFLLKNMDSSNSEHIDHIIDILVPQTYRATFVEFFSTYMLKENLDTSSLVLYYLLLNDKYKKHLDLIDFELNTNKVNLDSILKDIYRLPQGGLVIRKLLNLLGSKITSSKSLHKVLNAIINANLLPEIDSFLDKLDHKKFLERNPELNRNVERYFFTAKDSIFNLTQSLGKDHRYVLKELIIGYILKKENPSIDEILFLLKNSGSSNSSNQDLNINIKKYIFLLPIDILISFVGEDPKYFNQHEQELVSYLVSQPNLSFKEFKSEDLLELIKILIGFDINLIDSTEIKQDTTKVINQIFYQRADVLDLLRSECLAIDSRFKPDLIQIKEYLINHAFIQKPAKVKRDIVKKEKLTQKEKEGTIRLADIEDLITDLIELEDYSVVQEFLNIFNHLIEFEKTQTRNGRKESKETQKSLKAILNMFQNTSFEDKPLLKQTLFSNINEEVFYYLLDNITVYNNIKSVVFSIISFWIDNHQINASNTDWIVKIIKRLSDQNQIKFYDLYILVTKILNIKDINSFTIDTLSTILANLIKSDTKLIKTNDYNFKIFTSKNILTTLIPIISKHKEKVSDLLEAIKYRLSLKIPLLGIDDESIQILKINKEIIDSLSDLPLHRRIIATYILTDESLVYIKNGKQSFYKYIIDSLQKGISNSSSGDFIKELASLGLKSLESSIDLRKVILENSSIIINGGSNFASEEAKNLREKTSIYKVMEDKIKDGAFPIDLSDKKYVGLGYDVFCLENGINHYIEIKSKMSLFSQDWPIVISQNEIKFALLVHESDSRSKFSLYVVPLNNQEIRLYGTIIETKIDWEKLKYICEHFDVFETSDMNGGILIEHFVDKFKLKSKSKSKSESESKEKEDKKIVDKKDNN